MAWRGGQGWDLGGGREGGWVGSYGWRNLGVCPLIKGSSDLLHHRERDGVEAVGS